MAGMETVGTRIKAARERLDRSQQWLAKQIGVSREAVSQWEAGATQPKLPNVKAAAVALGVTYAWLLLGLEVDPAPPTRKVVPFDQPAKRRAK